MDKDRKYNNKIPELPKTLPPCDPVLLPSPSQNTRMCPNICFQSALFGMVARGRRKHLHGERIVSFKRCTITFAGKQLDQGDLDVFLHAIHLTAIETRKHNHRSGGLVHFSVRGFLKGIGRTPGKSGQLWLLNSIRRLSAAIIKIRLKGIFAVPLKTHCRGVKFQ